MQQTTFVHHFAKTIMDNSIALLASQSLKKLRPGRCIKKADVFFIRFFFFKHR
jgi:hypothetical protein